MNQMLDEFAGMGQLATVAGLFVRSDVMPGKLVDNRWASLFGVWLGGSMLRSAIVKTGAFEVYLGQKLVFSAIQRGKEVPKLEDVIAAFQEAGVTIKV